MDKAMKAPSPSGSVLSNSNGATNQRLNRSSTDGGSDIGGVPVLECNDSGNGAAAKKLPTSKPASPAAPVHRVVTCRRPAKCGKSGRNPRPRRRFREGSKNSGCSRFSLPSHCRSLYKLRSSQGRMRPASVFRFSSSSKRVNGCQPIFLIP